VFDGSLKTQRTFSRFKDKAYAGTFRPDGRLLGAGGEDGVVQVFDANSRAVLRQFVGHRRPVHALNFGYDKLHLLSGGDDATLRYWDISTGSQLARLTGHTDYVRALSMSPTSQDLWASGG
jgi:U3 small nucleolar RNA-associated protein 15